MSHFSLIRHLGLCLALVAPAAAQTLTRQNIANILGFENGTPGQFPAGWSPIGGGTIVIDDQVVHSGRYSARIELDASSSGAFTSLLASIPLDFAGQTIEWRGFLKTENVTDYVALWLREDDSTGSTVSFATLQGQNINGTADWKEYSVSVPVLQAGTQLVFGFFLDGPGKAWVDDLQLLADGQPVAQAPPRVPTVFDQDHEFDSGSRIALTSLSDAQIKDVARLAKVWGFLKYHHPAVTAGKHHWDYELFRVLPDVLAAADSDAVNAVLLGWIAKLGPVDECTDCATLDSSDLRLGTNLEWLADQSLLGADLSSTLESIYRNRPAANQQFFVSLAPGAGNPVFEHDLPYSSIHFPDSGYQLLALVRFWNMVQYFYPNRDVMADDPAGAPNYWNDVLEEFIPAVTLAGDSFTYQQALMRFIGRINDTHANLWSSLSARPPLGDCYLPVDVRFVEGRPLVLRNTSTAADPAAGLLPGDLIEQLDGVSVDDLVAQWRPFYADSNEAARMRDIGWYMTRGACGTAQTVVRRGDELVSVEALRLPPAAIDFSATYTHDLAGATFQMLSPDIAYLKLSSVKVADSADYILAAAGTKGLIIDIRNYPSEFVVFSLGSLLVSEPKDFVRFTYADVTNPGAFHWEPPLTLVPQEPHYGGKVIILVDEVTQSQAEYTTMAFRTAPGAIVIGSTTAGADGDVSTVPLPGGLSSYISGIGVYYPDNRPTQRVGIIPDIVVTPTIAAIQAGRDELIEAAICQILGDSAATAAGPQHFTSSCRSRRRPL